MFPLIALALASSSLATTLAVIQKLATQKPRSEAEYATDRFTKRLQLIFSVSHALTVASRYASHPIQLILFANALDHALQRLLDDVDGYSHWYDLAEVISGDIERCIVPERLLAPPIMAEPCTYNLTRADYLAHRGAERFFDRAEDAHKETTSMIEPIKIPTAIKTPQVILDWFGSQYIPRAIQESLHSTATVGDFSLYLFRRRDSPPSISFAAVSFFRALVCCGDFTGEPMHSSDYTEQVIYEVFEGVATRLKLLMPDQLSLPRGIRLSQGESSHTLFSVGTGTKQIPHLVKLDLDASIHTEVGRSRRARTLRSLCKEAGKVDKERRK